MWKHEALNLVLSQSPCYEAAFTHKYTQTLVCRFSICVPFSRWALRWPEQMQPSGRAALVWLAVRRFSRARLPFWPQCDCESEARILLGRVSFYLDVTCSTTKHDAIQRIRVTVLLLLWKDVIAIPFPPSFSSHLPPYQHNPNSPLLCRTLFFPCRKDCCRICPSWLQSTCLGIVFLASHPVVRLCLCPLWYVWSVIKVVPPQQLSASASICFYTCLTAFWGIGEVDGKRRHRLWSFL